MPNGYYDYDEPKGCVSRFFMWTTIAAIGGIVLWIVGAMLVNFPKFTLSAIGVIVLVIGLMVASIVLEERTKK